MDIKFMISFLKAMQIMRENNNEKEENESNSKTHENSEIDTNTH
jgi:hypothetical protein